MSLIPLVQSTAFAATCRHLGLPVRQHRLDGSCPADWLVRPCRLRGFGTVDIVSRGPVLSGAATAPDWLPAMIAASPRTLVLNAAAPISEALRDAGFWPLMTASTVAVLPLGPEAGMRTRLHQKWRNRLNRAQACGLQLQVHDLARTPDHWLLAAETAQARARRYRPWPTAVTQAFAQANPGAARIFEARHDGAAVAAMLFLRHGNTVTYHAGVTTNRGRALSAHTWLMWQAMTDLARRGADWIDLGTVNTDDAPGLARFKAGTGAQVLPLGGTWVRHPALAAIARRLPARLAA